MLLYLIPFHCYTLDNCLFSTKRQKGSDLVGRGAGEEMTEIEGGKTVIRIHCIRKESVFKKKKKEYVNK